MKLAFVFDGRFVRYHNQYYSTDITENVWKSRYLKVFDEIVVVGRVVDTCEDPSGKYVRCDLPNVSFQCMEVVPRIQRIMQQGKESKFILQSIEDCDYVLCRSWWGVKECLKLKKPYMIEVIRCAWDGLWYHSTIGKVFALPYYLLQRKAIWKAPYVAYVTKEFLQKRYPTKGVSIGVSDVELPSNPDAGVLEKRLEHICEQKKTLVLGTAGTVNTRYKGQQYIIEALAMLKQRGYTGFKYQIVGSGDQSRLRNIAFRLNIADQIEFLGPIPHDQVFEWLDSIDVYVQPSLTEGLPRSVVEAMSRGLPCIGSNAGGIPELLEESCICDIKKGLAKEYAMKLASIDRNMLEEQAKRNFAYSAEFNLDRLNEARIAFMKRFVEGE